MQSEEQQLIDGLFSRLKEAQSQSAPRDVAAEQHIAQHLQSQPAAPYYMAQTILIQEAAIKKLNAQIQALQGEIAQLKHAGREQSSGGFLAGLFGGGARPNANPIPGTQAMQGATPGSYTPPPATGAPGYAPRGGGGFMAGALQTAAGVAGGVVLGNMLTSMFSHTQPEELVNIINEPAQPVENAAVNAVDDYNEADDSQFLNQEAGLPQDNANDLMDTSWDDGVNDVGGDDDRWT